jgi:hypothetical protein
MVTITYRNGTVLRAILLSHKEDEIRAIAPDCDDALAFSCVRGTWISEEIEPVTIEFEWQRPRTSSILSEDDCICSKEVAARLIQMMFRDSEVDEGVAARSLFLVRRKAALPCMRSELEPR